MQWFQFLAGKFIHNRIHVAICSGVSVWSWSKITGYDLLPVDLWIVPLVILGIYQWNRTFDHNEDIINSPGGTVCRTAIFGLRFQCMCLFVFGLLFSFLKGEIKATYILLAVIVLGILYSTPLSGKTGKRLKNLFMIKNLTSATGWTLLVVFYPVLHSGEPFDKLQGLAALCMFGTVWVIEILWDIRDIRGDSVAGIRTVPVLLGVNAAKNLILCINTILAGTIVTAVIVGLIPKFWLVLLLNNFILYAWMYTIRYQPISRAWSHLLVGFQALLLVFAGWLAIEVI